MSMFTNGTKQSLQYWTVCCQANVAENNSGHVEYCDVSIIRVYLINWNNVISVLY